MSLRAKKKENLRQQLYDCAITLFRQHGYANVTVHDIVTAVGVAKGTFFNHYPTKAHILYEWYGSLSATAEKPSPGSSYKTAIRKFVLSQIKHAAAEPELLYAKLDVEANNPEILALENRSDEAARAYFRDVFTHAQKADEVRDDLPPSNLAALLVTLITGAVREWRIQQGKTPLERYVSKRLNDFYALLIV